MPPRHQTRTRRELARGQASIELILAIITAVAVAATVGTVVALTQPQVTAKVVCAVQGRQDCQAQGEIGQQGPPTPELPTAGQPRKPAYFLDEMLAGRSVHLGDSFSSGEGSYNYYEHTNKQWGSDKNVCHRTPYNWGQYVNLNNPAAGGFADASCSGAKADDFTKPNASNANEKAQLDNLDGSETLITFSLGGNDVGFGPVLQDCILGACNDKKHEDAMTANRKELLRKLTCEKGKTVGDKVCDFDGVYTQVQQRSPGAAVVIVGYPPLFSETSDVCFLHNAAACITVAEQRWANERDAELNTMLEQIAKERGFIFVSLNDFKEHGAGSKDPWLNRDIAGDITLGQPAASESFHPNQQGQIEIAKRVQAELEKRRRPGSTPTAPATYPSAAHTPVPQPGPSPHPSPTRTPVPPPTKPLGSR